MHPRGPRHTLEDGRTLGVRFLWRNLDQVDSPRPPPHRDHIPMTTPRTPEQDQEVAHHEAGHLEAACRLGFVCGPVTIDPDPDPDAGSEGCQSGEGPWADGSQDRPTIVVLFAGAAAERHRNPSADLSGCEGDNEQAAELLRLQPDGSEAELWAEAATLVAGNWPQIQAVAAALAQHRTQSEAPIIVDAVDWGDDRRPALEALRRMTGRY